MVTSALLSTVITGAALLAVLAVVFRLRDWQHPSPSVASAAGTARRANGPLGWSIAFFVIAFGLTGLAILYATGEPVAGLEPAAIGMLVLGTVLTVFGVGSLVAVYGAVRSRGLNSAQAAGLSSLLLGTLVLVAIAAQLLLSG